MLRAYSRRLLSPYVGMVQVVELGWARALSLDGQNWAIRYTEHENKQTSHARHSHDPRVNLSMILSIKDDQPKTRVIRLAMDPEQVRQDSERLFEVLRDITAPLKAADCYEYWLLDSHDNKPLALLHSCVDEEDMHKPVPHSEWFAAIPAAELAIPDPDASDTGLYQPPVNYRLQQCIEEIAGPKPQASWFKRTEPATVDLPPCLMNDGWGDPEYQRLCDLYLQRLSPRLLMMHNLPRTTREKLEQAAVKYVFEVEMYHQLYPEVVDNTLLNAALVEARLKRTNDGEPQRS
ncbi:MAG: hypothetical protein WBQ78_02590 [Gammaproteobacteria bacterium]